MTNWFPSTTEPSTTGQNLLSPLDMTVLEVGGLLFLFGIVIYIMTEPSKAREAAKFLQGK